MKAFLHGFPLGMGAGHLCCEVTGRCGLLDHGVDHGVGRGVERGHLRLDPVEPSLVVTQLVRADLIGFPSVRDGGGALEAVAGFPVVLDRLAQPHR